MFKTSFLGTTKFDEGTKEILGVLSPCGYGPAVPYSAQTSSYR